MTSGRPNILLLIADDLGADVVAISGSGASRIMQVSNDGNVGDLPNLSRLLRQGVYFNQAWAHPACSPTRASIYTGTHPWQNGVGTPNSPALDPSIVTALPNVLPSNCASGLFGKWHLGSSAGFYPTDHGWDKHVGTFGGVLASYTSWSKVDSDTYPTATLTSTYATEDTVNEAVNWINSLPVDQQWYATVAFHAPHSPFELPPSGTYTATTGASGDPATYNAMMQAVDYYIGTLTGPGGISASQLENTIVIFVGDNGSPAGIAEDEPKATIYEGGVRIPLMICDGQALVREWNGLAVTPRFLGPAKLNTSVDTLAHVIDLYRTIAELANLTSKQVKAKQLPSPAVALPADIRSFTLSPRVLATAPLTPVTPSKKLPLVVTRAMNFSQYYDTGNGIHLATIRNKNYKLNYDAGNSPAYQLFQYTNGRIELREDDGSAYDYYDDAAAGVNTDAETNLNSLLSALQAGYQADDSGTLFP